MENGMTKGDLLRMIGFMAVCVSIAWAAQIIGLGYSDSAFGRLLWLVAAGSVCGAGVGLVLTAGAVAEDEAATAAA